MMVSPSAEGIPIRVSPSDDRFLIEASGSVGGGGVIVAAVEGFGERGPSVARQEGQRPADAAVSTPHCGQSMLKRGLEPWERACLGTLCP